MILGGKEEEGDRGREHVQYLSSSVNANKLIFPPFIGMLFFVFVFRYLFVVVPPTPHPLFFSFSFFFFFLSLFFVFEKPVLSACLHNLGSELWVNECFFVCLFVCLLFLNTILTVLSLKRACIVSQSVSQSVSQRLLMMCLWRSYVP